MLYEVITAEYAIKKGVNSFVKFFGAETAKEAAESFGKADLLLGNNVLAHVPNINDFVSGMKILLKPQGTITVITSYSIHYTKLYDHCGGGSIPNQLRNSFSGSLLKTHVLRSVWGRHFHPIHNRS